MLFSALLKKLSERDREQRVSVGALREIIMTHHAGVGEVTFKYFPDFDGAGYGGFIWLEEERTSPYEEPFNDALVFINSKFATDRPMRRLIGAKELMHVFDTQSQRTANADDFRRLVNEIADMPIKDDASEQYDADRIALWKAIVALVPPWIRREHVEKWQANELKAPELAARLWLPEPIVSQAMGKYYEMMCERFEVDPNL